MTSADEHTEPEGYVELLKQVRRIHRELERRWKAEGVTRRRRDEEWQQVENAIAGAIDANHADRVQDDDERGRRVGRAALDAAREVQARWSATGQQPHTAP